MIKFFDMLFFGTVLKVNRIENMDNVNLSQLLSAILCMSVSHFLCIYSITVMFFPDYSDFDLNNIFLIMTSLFLLFYFVFIASGKYKSVESSYRDKKNKAIIISISANGFMIFTFFLMATIEINKTL